MAEPATTAPAAERKKGAVFDASKPYSPLSVPGEKTAVLLLDYLEFSMVRITPPRIPQILTSVVALKSWAHKHNALIIHGLLDVYGPPLPTSRSSERLQLMQQSFTDPTIALSVLEHPSIIATGTSADETARVLAEAEAGIRTTGQIEGPRLVGENEWMVKRQLGVIDAMRSEGLGELLKERGVRSLVMGGLSTSGCLAATARPAADDGFVVTVVEDACADKSEGVHEVVLESVVGGQVHVCGSEEWVGAWEEVGFGAVGK